MKLGLSTCVQVLLEESACDEVARVLAWLVFPFLVAPTFVPST